MIRVDVLEPDSPRRQPAGALGHAEALTDPLRVPPHLLLLNRPMRTCPAEKRLRGLR